MSKNIIIKKDGEPQTLNGVQRITTSEVDGGSCSWLPEDELGAVTLTANGSYDAEDYDLVGFAQVTVDVPEKTYVLGDLTATKNGSYNPASDGYDAYESVHVDVDTISGTMPDGNEYVLQLEPDLEHPEAGNIIIPQDENGNVVVKKIPSKIKIDTIPSKTVYRTGETVYLTGGVIKAYDGNDALWTDETYTTGVIPNSELEVAPLTVSYDAAVDAGGEIIEGDPTYKSYGNGSFPFEYSNVYHTDRPVILNGSSEIRAVGFPNTVQNPTLHSYYFLSENEFTAQAGSSDCPIYQYSGYYYCMISIVLSISEDICEAPYISDVAGDVGIALEYTFGSSAVPPIEGVTQEEEVTWICPYTDKPMKDSYEIVILKPETDDDEEWSQSSGGQHF